jgi:peroxiredoxin
MSLQQKLDAFKAEFEGKVPAHAVEVMHRSTEELIATGQADEAKVAGDTAPLFNLQDQDGNAVSLSDLLAKGPVVVTFYRGGWCAYCKMDLGALEEAAEAVRAKGASLVAISPQTPANSRKSKNEIGLSFPILSDTKGATADAFGLRFRMQDELIDVYRGFGVNLPMINGDDSWTLPMPARFIIGQDGKIAYAEVNPDYTQRPDPSELMATLDQLQKQAA